MCNISDVSLKITTVTITTITILLLLHLLLPLQDNWYPYIKFADDRELLPLLYDTNDSMGQLLMSSSSGVMILILNRMFSKTKDNDG